jgi:hypothetical protein
MVQCDAIFASAFTLEARVGGPVQFRWIYSQERELKNLDLRFAARQGLRGVLQRHSRVNILQTSQACISHTSTT